MMPFSYSSEEDTFSDMDERPLKEASGTIDEDNVEKNYTQDIADSHSIINIPDTEFCCSSADELRAQLSYKRFHILFDRATLC